MNDTDKRRVLVGRIGAAHGVRGEVRVRSFTDDPMALGAYGPLATGDGRTLTVAAARPAKGMLVVRFAEVADRERAEALNGSDLFVPRSALPAPDKEEYYHADLIGLPVFDAEDRPLGVVAAMPDFGAGPLLEIAGDDGETAFVPFTRAAVPVIDLAGGRIVVDRPGEVAVNNTGIGEIQEG